MPAQCCKDFYERIPDEVPVFTLVAWDRTAPQAIRTWLAECLTLGAPTEKILKGIEHLKAIEEWQEKNPDKVKTPD